MDEPCFLKQLSNAGAVRAAAQYFNPAPIYSSMTYLTCAAGARFYGGHHRVRLGFTSGWDVSQKAGEVGEFKTPLGAT